MAENLEVNQVIKAKRNNGSEIWFCRGGKKKKQGIGTTYQHPQGVLQRGQG